MGASRTPPLVSILLPTRNRLEYLRFAVETVLRQDDPDWEIAISDNASDDDIAGYIAALGDDRIRFARSDSFVPVTENWNRALALSSGRYVLMLGDDDGLMPGYVATLRRLVEHFDAPELIYGSAWLFAYPDVLPDEPAGYLQPYGYATFLRRRRAPFVLDRRTARTVVRQSLGFRMKYGVNMQFSSVSRQLIERLADRGPFFQSAFPDYYATNVAFLNADRIVVEPTPLVVIGITPKSYGYFHFNSKEEAGKSFLGEDAADAARTRLESVVLPGTHINVGWLSALETMRIRYEGELPDQPDYARFRRLQIIHTYEGKLRGTVSETDVGELESHLRPAELRLARSAAGIAELVGRVLPRIGRRAASWAWQRLVVRQWVPWRPARIRGRYRTLLDVFESPPERESRRPRSLRLR
jgi:glycosyltransferase involved in cell wall biosynthesis